MQRRTFLGGLAATAVPGSAELPTLPPATADLLDNVAWFLATTELRGIDARTLAVNFEWARPEGVTERHLATLERHGYAIATYYPATIHEPGGFVYELTDAGRRRAQF